MIYRTVCFLILISVCLSCNQFSNSKKKIAIEKDTILDFSTIDESPTFKECEELLDKAKKDCFRANMRQKFTNALKQYTISSKKSLEETISVTLIIDKEGVMFIDNVESSASLKSILPEIDTILQNTVTNFPKLFPATKRGIPVTTQYTLPIHIKTEE